MTSLNLFKKRIICFASAVLVFGWLNIALAEDGVPDISLEQILINAINWAVSIVALLAVLILVIAGMIWITSGGDAERVESVRKWIVGAVGGLIISLAAWSMVKVIVSLFDVV